MGSGGVLGMPRTDGFTDGFDTIQGVRSYDSTAGSWTTPDAYAGDVHDPSSQKSYIWNANNPVAYGDPTGYYGVFDSNVGANAQPIATDYYAGDPNVLQPTANSAIQVQEKLQQANQQLDPKNGSYANYNEAAKAAKAAQAHYGAIIGFLLPGQEIGCGLYCTNSGCGFEPAINGSDRAVAPGLTDRDRALWHAHPKGDPDSSLEGHDDNVRVIMASMGSPFSIYTTLTDQSTGIMTLKRQVYDHIPAPGDPLVPVDNIP
jgi:hypothetical protein